MEVPGGFEPPNNGFADRPLGPLGHGTPNGNRSISRRKRIALSRYTAGLAGTWHARVPNHFRRYLATIP